MEILLQLENEIMELIGVITPKGKIIPLRKLIHTTRRQSDRVYHKRRKATLLEKYAARGYAFDPRGAEEIKAGRPRKEG